MNILFTSAEVVDICQGKYYSRNLQQHIDKYKYLGQVICACHCREAERVNMTELDMKSADFIFTPKSNKLKTWFKSARERDEIIKNAVSLSDMIVCHVPSGNSYSAIKYAKKLGKPYFVVVVGCAWDAMWNYDWRGKILAIRSFYNLKRYVRNAPFAIYVTQRFLQQRYPCKGFTEYASNVCIAEPSSDVLNRRLKKIKSRKKGDPINIVTVAAVNVRYKGQEYVINALKYLNIEGEGDYHYYMIGGGDNSFLKNYAKKLGVEQYVHFVGSLPNNEVFKQLDAMDIYIQPSKQEGLPRALIEAMSRALPAIGTNVAGIPELLDPEFLVRKSSVSDIVKAVTDMNLQSMLKQANVNFEKSKEYSINKINNRRNKFFDLIINEFQIVK